MLPIDVETEDIFGPVLELVVRIRNKKDLNNLVVQLHQFTTLNDRDDDKLIEFNGDKSDDNFPSFDGSS